MKTFFTTMKTDFRKLFLLQWKLVLIKNCFYYTETSISLFWSFRSRSHFSLPTTMCKTLFDGYQPIEYFILWKFWNNRSYKKNFPWKTNDFFVTLSRPQCTIKTVFVAFQAGLFTSRDAKKHAEENTDYLLNY